MTRLDQFLNNPNIDHYIIKGELYIEIVSYNFCTLENPRKTKQLFERLKKYKNKILEKFNVKTFVCSVSGYNIDGLYESNSLLLFDNSKLYLNY